MESPGGVFYSQRGLRPLEQCLFVFLSCWLLVFRTSPLGSDSACGLGNSLWVRKHRLRALKQHLCAPTQRLWVPTQRWRVRKHRLRVPMQRIWARKRNGIESPTSACPERPWFERIDLKKSRPQKLANEKSSSQLWERVQFPMSDLGIRILIGHCHIGDHRTIRTPSRSTAFLIGKRSLQNRLRAQRRTFV